MILKYGLDWQWKEISKNAVNGNWTHAFENCVEYGFFSNDLIRHYNEEEYHLLEATDLAILSEGASNIRAKRELIGVLKAKREIENGTDSRV